MNINDYKDVNGQIENSKELIEDIVGAINGVVESGSGANGNWVKFSNGLIFQWGTATMTKVSNYYLQATIVLPTPMKTNTYVRDYLLTGETSTPVGKHQNSLATLVAFTPKYWTLNTLTNPSYNESIIWWVIGY